MSYNPVRPRPNLVQDQPTYPVQPRIHGRGWGVEGFTTFAGMVYSFHGESESGKSLVVQAECACLLNGGEVRAVRRRRVGRKSVVDRLRQLGAGPRGHRRALRLPPAGAQAERDGGGTCGVDRPCCRAPTRWP